MQFVCLLKSIQLVFVVFVNSCALSGSISSPSSVNFFWGKVGGIEGGKRGGKGLSARVVLLPTCWFGFLHRIIGEIASMTSVTISVTARPAMRLKVHLPPFTTGSNGV